jgi:stage II sporulation protein D
LQESTLIDTRQDSLYQVVFEDNRGRSAISLEEYLIGILATTIDIEYEEETLKAQAVLLRSTLLYEMNKENVMQISAEQFDYTYMTEMSWKKIWKEKYGTYYEKCQRAVNETEGITLSYKGENIPGTFCAVSAGATRAGEEEQYPYLKGVLCSKSVESADYLNLYHFPKDTWETIEVIASDERGYVTQIEVDGREMSGEDFRKQYNLASACMKILKGENYLIETRGKGHGFGMDQYYANCLALEGEDVDYMEILQYFYENISFEKTASYKN